MTCTLVRVRGWRTLLRGYADSVHADLQPLSPQLIKTDSKFIKGASAGDIFNTVTGQFWEGDEGVTIIPCAYEMKFLEFQLRESGGGFLGEIDPNNPTFVRRIGWVPMKCCRRVTSWSVLPSSWSWLSARRCNPADDSRYEENPDEGCQAVEYSPCGYEADAPGEGSVYSAHVGYVWNLKTVQESNDKGSWFNYSISQLDIKVPSAAVQECKGLYEMFRKARSKRPPELPRR